MTWSTKEDGKSLEPHLEIVDPTGSSEWDEAVALHPFANIFHTSAWAKVLSETYGHRPRYIRWAERGRSMMLLPLMEVDSSFTGRRGVSLPFSDLCVPLFCEAAEPSGLIARLQQWARERRWRHFELRGADFLHDAAPPIATFYEHSLNLTTPLGNVVLNFSSSVRRNLRKAERSGVTSEVLCSRDAILQYYKLHASSRKRHGAPPQPVKFFLNIYEHIIKLGLGFVVLARRGGEAIAGAVFLHFGKNGTYKFGASDEKFQEYRASNVVISRGIQHLSEGGFSRLHFGRTSRFNEGLRRFKLGWGVDEKTLEYFRFRTVSGRWETEKSDLDQRAAKLFRRLPLVANRLLGMMIYPHLD